MGERRVAGLLELSSQPASLNLQSPPSKSQSMPGPVPPARPPDPRASSFSHFTFLLSFFFFERGTEKCHVCYMPGCGSVAAPLRAPLDTRTTRR
eukprot:scaffold4914_cov137-Isochrysis_galbana.AAC.3